MRLFFALVPPADIRAVLLKAMYGVPGARWQNDAQLHLTLVYAGELETERAEDLLELASAATWPAPRLKITRPGCFADGGQMKMLWAGVEDVSMEGQNGYSPLHSMHERLVHMCQQVGIAMKRRKFIPHITLARFSRSQAPPEQALADYAQLWHETMERYAPDGIAAFEASEIILFESYLGRHGSHYEPLVRLPCLRRASR